MPPTVFISYSQRDARWKDRLAQFLGVFQHEGLLYVWHDELVQPGTDWLPEIERAMADARVAIFLVSMRFLNSEFVRRKEVPVLMERRQKEGLRLIPVIVSPCPWQTVAWLSAIQAWPLGGNTLAGLRWTQQDAVLSRLAEEVVDLVANRLPEEDFASLAAGKPEIVRRPATRGVTLPLPHGTGCAADAPVTSNSRDSERPSPLTPKPPVSPPLGDAPPRLAGGDEGPIEGNGSDPASGDRPPTTRQRFLQGRFPTRVRLGDTVTLQARVALEASVERSVPLNDLVVPPEGLGVLLVLHAPGFEILDGNQLSIRILPEAPSDWLPFSLKAVRSGIHAVEVTAYGGAAFLGTLTLEVTVEDSVATGESREHRQLLRRRLADDEITLRIRYDEDARVYRFQLIDGSIIPPEEIPAGRLMQTPVEAVESLVKGLNVIAQGQSQFTAAETHAWLRNKGIELWQSFIPLELQLQFWNLQDQIKRILIVSDSKGDPVPWELLYPLHPHSGSAAGYFFAERFLVGRWLAAAQPPAPQIHLGSAAFVKPAPDDSLPQAEAEIAAIRRLIRDRGIETGEPIGDLTSLLDLLKSGDFNLLHLACHNSYRSAEISLGGSAFQPVFLREHQGRFAHAAPLVFINACRSNVQVPHYTMLEGWARAFLTAGAGAFVGTLWVVRDASAARFATEFYTTLLSPERRSLGEALQAGRNAIREVPGDPTWLAYTLYGDTAATLA
jgi:CHAT domain-containing protein